MSAPAFILLARGSTRPVVSEVIRQMRAHLQQLHPTIAVHIAFCDHEHPSVQRVVSRLERSGAREAVLVPLNLANVVGHSQRLDEVLAAAGAQCPAVTLRVARPVGPGAGLLTRVDQRLREALTAAHATELDGLVLATEPTTDRRSRSLLARRARQWSMHHKLPAVVASQDIARAIDDLRSQGRRHIAVGSLFLTAHDLYQQCRAEALRAGVVAVGDPIGFAPEACDMAFGRYAVAAMDLVAVLPGTGTSPEPHDPGLHVVGA